MATLSRGYKRKSEGFILADTSANAEVLGDEPFQFYTKFKNIQVAVDADRKNGIEQLLSQTPKPEVILLDDAYQHRKVKAGFYILLTSYGELYCDDVMLPSGSLRESRGGAKRANIIIVTKCPTGLSVAEQEDIKTRLKIAGNQKLYFTSIEYDEFIYSENGVRTVKDSVNTDKLLLAGIAKPASFFAYLQSENEVCMEFPDHHHFSEKDILDIKNKSLNKIIITTEKDYVRLQGRIPADQLFYLPIRSQFLVSDNDFRKTIMNYVGTSTRDSQLHQ